MAIVRQQCPNLIQRERSQADLSIHNDVHRLPFGAYLTHHITQCVHVVCGISGQNLYQDARITAACLRLPQDFKALTGIVIKIGRT